MEKKKGLAPETLSFRAVHHREAEAGDVNRVVFDAR
jgi:hypothetical protein